MTFPDHCLISDLMKLIEYLWLFSKHLGWNFHILEHEEGDVFRIYKGNMFLSLLMKSTNPQFLYVYILNKTYTIMLVCSNMLMRPM